MLHFCEIVNGIKCTIPLMNNEVQESQDRNPISKDKNNIKIIVCATLAKVGLTKIIGVDQISSRQNRNQFNEPSFIK